MENILVVFGGKSLEHDISVITGVLAVNSIDKNKYKAIPVYIDKDGTFYTGNVLKDIGFYKKIDYSKLKKVYFKCGDNTLYTKKFCVEYKIAKISLYLNCTHGENGEDGSLDGYFRTCDINSCSPSLLPSALCMDKWQSKIYLKGLLVNTVKGVSLTDDDDIEKKTRGLKFPLIVKPNKGGSSIGIIKVEKKEDLFPAVISGLKFGKSVIVEECLENFTEINCAVFRGLNDKIYVSECEKPLKENEVLSFSDKYVLGRREFPAKIDEELKNKIKKLAEKVYLSLDTIGVIRIDFFVLDNKVYVNEINTVPGSLAYYLFTEKTSEFTKMLDEIIKVGLDFDKKERLHNKTFDTGVLTGLGAKGSKHL